MKHAGVLTTLEYIYIALVSLVEKLYKMYGTYINIGTKFYHNCFK